MKNWKYVHGSKNISILLNKTWDWSKIEVKSLPWTDRLSLPWKCSIVAFKEIRGKNPLPKAAQPSTNIHILFYRLPNTFTSFLDCHQLPQESADLLCFHPLQYTSSRPRKLIWRQKIVPRHCFSHMEVLWLTCNLTVIKVAEAFSAVWVEG